MAEDSAPPRSLAAAPLRRRAILGAAALSPLAGRAVAASTPAGVALYASPASRRYLAGVGGDIATLLNPWHRLIEAQGWGTRVVDSAAELERVRPAVLVLPSAVALDAAERAALLAFRRQGGALLVSGSTGVRDGSGQWLGHDWSRELTGVQVTGEIADDSLTRFLVPYGDTPVNQQTPAGRRLWLGKVRERALTLSGGTPAAAYTDWARTVLQLDRWPAGIVYDEPPGGARVVRFGFAETAWDFQPASIQALAADALRWLLRLPTAQLAAWPHGRRAAQLIEMDTEEGFANAVHFAELMEEIRAAGTFYCLSSEARKHPDLLQRLVRRHEVGFHGEVHLGFRWYTPDHQKRRLERMMAEMREVLGGLPGGWPLGAGRGFRAPTEGYDEHTERLLQALGMRHHTADPNASDDRLPFFSKAGPSDPAEALVVLPRGQLDDLNYLELGLDAARLGPALVAEYEFNQRMGGLGIISVHSQNFANPAVVPQRPRQSSLMTTSVETLTRHIGPRHDRVWIAPGGAIADWWRDRARVRLTSAPVGTDELTLRLEVSAGAPVQGLTVQVHHRTRDAAPSLRGEPAGPRPGVLRRLDAYTSQLTLERLAPGVHQWRVSVP